MQDLGYFSEGEYEEPEEEWSFEEPIRQPKVFEPDVFSNVLTKDMPGIILNMDLNTLSYFCETNKRINHVCQLDQFWYAKLEHDYPEYVSYFQNSETYLGRLIYRDMSLRPQTYYIVYNYFRNCLATIGAKNVVIGKETTYTITDQIEFIKNKKLSESTLKILLSLTLPYTQNTYNMLSKEVLMDSMIPGGYYGNQKQLTELMDKDYGRWKRLKCVIQTYGGLPNLLY
jgi:hypothetical protein